MRLILAVLMLALIIVPALSQTEADPKTAQANKAALFTGASYADGEIDTSAIKTIGGVSRMAVRLTYLDSINVAVRVDYRPSPSGSWVATYADTVTATAAGVSEVILRNNATENVPGVSGQIRIRHAFLASDNGVTSATYTSELIWKP